MSFQDKYNSYVHANQGLKSLFDTLFENIGSPNPSEQDLVEIGVQCAFLYGAVRDECITREDLIHSIHILLAQCSNMCIILPKEFFKDMCVLLDPRPFRTYVLDNERLTFQAKADALFDSSAAMNILLCELRLVLQLEIEDEE